MKKFVLALGAVAMLGMTACDSSSSSSSNGSDSFGDSLSVAFGVAQGGQFAQMIENNFTEEQKAKFNKDSFLRGFKQVLMADTADMAYLQGISTGMQMIQSIMAWEQQGEISVNRNQLYSEFAKSFKGTINDEKIAADAAELQTLFNQLQVRMQTIMSERQQEAAAKANADAEENTQKGEAYMADLKAKDSSIKTTESGLSYKVIKQGTGALPTADDEVKVIYKGNLIDGTEFDSSNGEAVVFGLKQVVPGFREGLEMMNPGSKYILYIPASLAYGNQPAGSIPPGSTLIFEVEVTDFNN
ncbi:MAG: FKBP-type peptidyl-prolyl cis-trans isomerase [Paramuribaculum sp.]|nr:FKBP-type peptidyl-prolyl cis-trans isomerase [Paramuribaculum sp.]MDE6304119.1 FKBP-type peptidyl-prolyl cis-trans isomerase [Paramuribaculum sp.]